MKIVFWGTPSYAIPILNSLINSEHDVLAVVTQPDRRRGRGKKVSPSEVKSRALELGIEIFTPVDIKRQIEIQNQIEKIKADIYIVVAFGQILPEKVLSQPTLGCWNIHASLLPYWRGAAPIQWSLISGDSKTGVAIMAMEKGLDTGPILKQSEIKIGLLENAKQLSDRLSNLSSLLILDCLKLIKNVGEGSKQKRYTNLNLTNQEDINCQIKYAPPIKKEDTLIEWTNTAFALHKKIMGLYPNAYTYWKGKRLKILSSIPMEIEYLEYINRIGINEDVIQSPENSPGEITHVIKEVGIIVSTTKSMILLTEVQLQGKHAVSNSSMVQQLKASVGDKFGN